MNGLSGHQLELAALCLEQDLSSALAGVAPALEKAASNLDGPIDEADKLIEDYETVVEGYKINRDSFELSASAGEVRQRLDESAANITDPHLENSEKIADAVRKSALEVAKANQAAKSAAEEARRKRVAAERRATRISSFFDLVAAGADAGAMFAGSGSAASKGAVEGQWFRYTEAIKTYPDGTRIDIREGEGFTPNPTIEIGGQN